MCDIDHDQEPKVWNERRVRARKLYRCDCCEGFIRPGTVYLRHFSVFDDSVSHERACAGCAAMIDKFREVHHTAYVPYGMEQGLYDCIDAERDEGNVKMVRLWTAELRKMHARKETRRRALQREQAPQP